MPQQQAAEPIVNYHNFIAGAELPSASGRTFTTVDPTHGNVAFSFAEAEAADIDGAVRAAYAAWESGPWARTSAAKRGRLLMKLGDLILENADRIARIETRRDSGLPLLLRRAR
jgi:acyl-CoA reductase-like NAD-dependent aldehyde dehydrogenase